MFEFLVGDYGILFGLLAVCIGIVRLYPNTVRTMVFDNDAKYRLVSRAAIGAMVAFPIWATVFDNWRQLIGVPTGWIWNQELAIASDPFFSGEVSDTVRLISWVLCGLAVVGGAYLFARYATGYVAPILVAPLALIFFFTINTFRLRMDVESVRIAAADIDGPAEIISTLFWVVGLYVSMAILIISLFLIAWGPAAILVGIVYRRTIGKIEIEEPQIFKRLSERRASQTR